MGVPSEPSDFQAFPTESNSPSKSSHWGIVKKVSVGLGVCASFALLVASRHETENTVAVEDPFVPHSALRTASDLPRAAEMIETEQGSMLAAGSFPPVQVKQPQFVIGWPTSGYHNVTIWVYVKALEQLNYNNIKLITYTHPQLYPMFTGGEPVKDDKGVPVCKEKGCAELCREHGFAGSPCVDMVGDSNIPVNHATWLEDFQDQYDVFGTAFESQYIGLFAPDYAPFKTLSAAATNSDTNKTIVGFQSGPGDGCDGAFCPKCAGQPFLTDPKGPILTNSFNLKSYPCTEFEAVVAGKLAKREIFMVEMWVPMFWNARFPQLEALDMEQYTDGEKPNQGKILIRKDRKYKLDSKALSVLGAIFIGTKNVIMMDGWANGFGIDQPLCDYWDFDHSCASEAAQKWIDANRVNKLWDSFFW